MDPSFTYAYTLAGHEHVSNEDFDKATVNPLLKPSCTPKDRNPITETRQLELRILEGQEREMR